MEYGAIDLHLRRSVFRIEDPTGTLGHEGRIDTSRADLTRVFGARAPMPVLVESSTDSEWVAVLLESFGHEVIVADPSYLPMYGERQRQVKTDQRDVRALVTACRHGHYRRAHRVAPATRTLRQELRIRRHLVQMRTQTINVLRALLRQEGLRLPSGDADYVRSRLARVALPPALAQVLQPLRDVAPDAADADRHGGCRHRGRGGGGSGGAAPHERARRRPGDRAHLSCGARHARHALPAIRVAPARFSASCRRNIAPVISSAGDTSRNEDHANSGRSSCKRAGSCGAGEGPRVRPCAPGRTPWPPAAVVASRSSRWRAV